MTTAEVVTVVTCLVIGYCVVAVVVAPSKRDGAGDDSLTGGRGEGTRGNPGERPREEPVAASWHDVLGVPETSSREEISAAYKRLIGQYHPDRVMQMGKDIRELAEVRAREINAAYDLAMKDRR